MQLLGCIFQFWLLCQIAHFSQSCIPQNLQCKSKQHTNTSQQLGNQRQINLTSTSLDLRKKPQRFNSPHKFLRSTFILSLSQISHLEKRICGPHANVKRCWRSLNCWCCTFFSHVQYLENVSKDLSPYGDVLQRLFPDFWGHFIHMDRKEVWMAEGELRRLWIPGVSSAKVTKARGDSDKKIARLCYTSPTCKFSLQTNCTV